MSETPSPAGPRPTTVTPGSTLRSCSIRPSAHTSRQRAANEARRLNAALEDAAPGRERRFAPASERREEGATSIEGEPDELPISDGARLMITNLATTGASREEILELMRNELGLEDAEAILDRLSI